MTATQDVYAAFLSKILDDEWANWGEPGMEGYVDPAEDWLEILRNAISWFKFPRHNISLDATNTNFVEDLTNDEIQILATRMKCEWLNRSILTWERIKPLYEERDFSEANMLDKLNATLDKEIKRAEKLEAKYYRSINFKPFDYTKLAGD